MRPDTKFPFSLFSVKVCLSLCDASSLKESRFFRAGVSRFDLIVDVGYANTHITEYNQSISTRWRPSPGLAEP